MGNLLHSRPNIMTSALASSVHIEQVQISAQIVSQLPIEPAPLPFAHLGDGNPSIVKGHLLEKFGIGAEAYSNRNSRISQDMFAISGGVQSHNYGINQVRSRAGSSFDINDCFSNENHIDDLMALGSLTKVPVSANNHHYNPSLFKKNH